LFVSVTEGVNHILPQAGEVKYDAHTFRIDIAGGGEALGFATFISIWLRTGRSQSAKQKQQGIQRFIPVFYHKAFQVLRDSIYSMKDIPALIRGLSYPVYGNSEPVPGCLIGSILQK